jgi:hypothetical protein
MLDEYDRDVAIVKTPDGRKNFEEVAKRMFENRYGSC